MQMRAAQTAGGNRVRCRLDLRRDLIVASNRRAAAAATAAAAPAQYGNLLFLFKEKPLVVSAYFV